MVRRFAFVLFLTVGWAFKLDAISRDEFKDRGIDCISQLADLAAWKPSAPQQTLLIAEAGAVSHLRSLHRKILEEHPKAQKNSRPFFRVSALLTEKMMKGWAENKLPPVWRELKRRGLEIVRIIPMSLDPGHRETAYLAVLTSSREAETRNLTDPNIAHFLEQGVFPQRSARQLAQPKTEVASLPLPLVKPRLTPRELEDLRRSTPTSFEETIANELVASGEPGVYWLEQKGSLGADHEWDSAKAFGRHLSQKGQGLLYLPSVGNLSLPAYDGVIFDLNSKRALYNLSMKAGGIQYGRAAEKIEKFSSIESWLAWAEKAIDQYTLASNPHALLKILTILGFPMTPADKSRPAAILHDLRSLLARPGRAVDRLSDRQIALDLDPDFGEGLTTRIYILRTSGLTHVDAKDFSLPW